MNNLVAVIPVRKGSQRVNNKNFRSFANENLLIKKIKILKKIKSLDKIIINTDSDKAIKIAKSYNLDFHKREDYFASSSCPNSIFWKNVAEATKSKHIMFVNCTSPLIKKKTIEDLIKIFKKKILTKKYDSINTVSAMKEFLFFKNKPMNFKNNKTPNSQDLPDIVKLNFAISILSTKDMSKNKSLVGKKPYLFALNEVEGFDIDTEFEFDFAEYLYKKINKNG